MAEWGGIYKQPELDCLNRLNARIRRTKTNIQIQLLAFYLMDGIYGPINSFGLISVYLSIQRGDCDPLFEYINLVDVLDTFVMDFVSVAIS